MPQFNKRGNRIRASDKSLVFCFSAGSLLLLFLTVVMLLNLKTILTTDWKAISLFQDGSVHFTVTPYRIVTVIVSALVCVIAALFYQHFQYDRVKQLFHRQKLAKMILENGWYESETTQGNGFFKDLPASTKKEKITYFPKLYYRMDNGLLYIRIEITLGKYQDQLLHLEKKLETGLYCELISKELKDSYVEYVLLYDTIANRISIDEVQAEHDVIILYLIAGVSFTFALFNCILFALKHGKTMKTDGMIVSIKSTNPTNEKWRNAKLAEVSYLVNGKRIVSKNRIQVSLASEIGTHIPIRYDRNQPDKIYSYSVKRIIIGFLIGVGSILIAVFMQIH